MSYLTILRKLGFPYQVTLPKKLRIVLKTTALNMPLGKSNTDSAYMKIISRGRMTVPLYSPSNYVCEAFALLDYFNEIKLLTNQIYQPEPQANTH